MSTVPVNVNIDQAVYQKALQRAQSEGRLLDDVVSQLLGAWTQGGVSKAPTARYQEYTVKRGDTLAQIALKHYGDAKKYIDIAQFNSITNPAMIRVGQVLRIPALGALPETPTPSQPVQPTPSQVKLDIEFTQSPHYNQRPAGSKIWTIVVHSTANSTLEGVVKWFLNPQSFVSAHYNIGKDGKIAQMVQEELRAWHAGKSVWKNIYNVNDFSIGIEMVNKNDGVDPYPEAQYKVLVALCKQLVSKYGIKVEDIVGHKEISLSGKTDPAGFDIIQLRKDVAA